MAKLEKIRKSDIINDKFISLMMDTTFKYLIKKKETRGWFLSLIKDVTNLDLTNYDFSNIEINSGNHNKNYLTDLRITKGRLNTVIIEVNTNSVYSDSIDVKNKSYLFSEEGNYLKSGDNYIRKYSKLICFNNYLNPLDKSVKSLDKVLMDRDSKRFIEDYIEIFEIYIPVFSELWYNGEEEKKEFFHKFAMLNATSSKEFNELVITEEDKVIAKELELLKVNDEFINAYDGELNQRRLINSAKIEGYENGVEQGKLDEKKEIIKNMLNKNMNLEDISEIVGLSIREINNLINEL